MGLKFVGAIYMAMNLKQTWPTDLKMKIVQYLRNPGLDSF
jgi:hypothetical protein